MHGAFVSSGAVEGGGAYRTDRAYSVGVMPNFSLNWREKWCTVEYCRAAAISVKFRLFSRIICLLQESKQMIRENNLNHLLALLELDAADV